MIIRKCRKLAKLDNEEITAVDRDVAKNYENMNSSEIRPNTSVGNAHHSNIIEDLFPSEAQHNFDENINNEDEELKLNKNPKEEEVYEINEEVNTKITLNANKIETKIKDTKTNEIEKHIINTTSGKPSADTKKVIRTQTFSNFLVKDKIISQVEYIPRSNIASNNSKKVKNK